MPSFFEPLLLLLAPVAALLFLNLRLSRRLVYPHELLAEEVRKTAATMFFRAIRAYYDLLFDMGIAVVAALAIAAWAASQGDVPPGSAARKSNAAVVIDCSRSMFMGRPGSRPLDLALKFLSSDQELAQAKAFALAFDPSSLKSRLTPLYPIFGREKRGHRDIVVDNIAADGTFADTSVASALLRAEFDFFAVDYSVMDELRRKGFDRITLITDFFPERPVGFEVVEVGFADGTPRTAEYEAAEATTSGAERGGFSAYPTSIRLDGASGTFLVAFAESGPRDGLEIGALREDGTTFPLPVERFRIEERAVGRAIRIASDGLYLVRLRAPQGEEDAVFAFRLPSGTIHAAANGPFSARVLDALPYLERSTRPELLLADGDLAQPGTPAPRSTPGGAMTIRGATRLVRTHIVESDERELLSAAFSGARLIVGGARGGAQPSQAPHRDATRRGDIECLLGPAARANEDLALFYDGIITSTAEMPFATAVPEGTRHLIPLAPGTYLAETPRGMVPLNAPPREFFVPSREGVMRLPPQPPGRMLYATLLALLFAGKLLAWRLSSGKSLVSR